MTAIFISLVWCALLVYYIIKSHKLKVKLNKSQTAYIEVYSKYQELKNCTPRRDKNGRYSKKQTAN